MIKKHIFWYILGISVLFTTCQKEKPEPPDFSNQITITTGKATEVSYRSAKLTGTLAETYGQEITDYGHCWDSISKPTTDDDKTSFGSVTTAKSFSSKIDDIVPGKKYYTRVYFIIGETIVYGSQQSFTTLKLDKPVVETVEAINVGITSANLSGKVVDAMGDSITGRGFCYGSGPDPAIESDSVVVDTLQTTGNFSMTIDSLKPGRTYYARAFATNNTGIGYGDEISLTTGIDLPSIATTEVTGISDSTAVCGGENIDAGGGTISQKGICWGTEADVTLENATGFSEEGTGAEAFTTSIEGLDYAKTYYVRAYIKNETGTGYGEIKSFNTKKALPKVSPVQITLRTATGANTAGEVINDGGAEVTSRGVCWNTIGNPTISDNKTTDGTGTGSFTSNLTELKENTTYYVRAYAINEIGAGYGDEINFTTKDGIPALTTADATEITATTAVSGGAITDNGGASITARGVCWSTNENPTIEDNKTSDGTGTGSFNSNLRELEANTTYYVRAYATNTVGTEYGTQLSFTTNDGIPALTTADATEITATTAVSGGTITDNGGASITSRGVCWSTTENPTTADNKTIDGTGTGSFTSNLTKLQVNTTYYVRAYATNAYATQYGNQISFIANGTRVLEVTNPETGQIWMDRNLGASRTATSSTDEEAYGDLYQWGRATDGHEKRNSGTTSTLSSSDTPGHGNFITSDSSPNDWRSPQNDNLWQGVNGTNNPCPSGYRLPTEAEWEAERQSWSSNDAAGAFASPLKLPMAGFRNAGSGSLDSVGSYGGYWSSTVDGTYSRYRGFNSSAYYMVSSFRAGGFSVRCLQD